MHAPAVAAHRFGYAEPDLRPLRTDPRDWVLAQLQRPAPMDATGLADGQESLRLTRGALAAALQPRVPGDAASAINTDSRRVALRRANLDWLHRRWQHMASTPTPVAERWVQFWANHFCVAATKGSTAGLVWVHEHEAVRPHAFGNFRELLRAATLHPGMLLYLDNAQSIGPDSQAGRRRGRGLNENLARELLELHTLGVNSGYTQADVTEAARVLTGWTVTPPEGPPRVFNTSTRQTVIGFDPPAHAQGISGFLQVLHQPGSKRVLGKTYASGPQAAHQLFDDLSRHPACARHLAYKLVRHFTSDEPDPGLVQAVAQRFTQSDGDLLATARALFTDERAWAPSSPVKLRRPEELLVAAHRLLRLPLTPDTGTLQAVNILQAMGQPMGRAPSPQGWPDRAEDWLSPDALYKRVQWAERFGREHGARVDARALARDSLADALTEVTARQLDQAESGAQALALLLASPEFQRR